LKDFFLSTKLKSVLKGRRFESGEEIKETSLAELRITKRKKGIPGMLPKLGETLRGMHEKC